MKSRLLVAAAAAVALSTSAWADEDCALHPYGSVPLTQIPGHASEFVPVEIAGVPKLLLLDTGASITLMKSSAVRELNLQTNRAGVTIFDVTGVGSSLFVAASLKVADFSVDKVLFMVGTPYIDAVGDERTAGLLGADILKHFDISIDFGAHTFTMLDQKHCDGKVVYWPERPVAIIPFHLQGDAIILPVTLDGHEFEALLDTGASISTLERARAEGNFNIVLGSADTPAGVMDSKGTPVWKHRFKSLSLAGIEVANPEIEIIPDKTSTKVNPWSTGSMLDRQYNGLEQAPMLLGMNVLRHLHIYIAYKERKLYITPAGTPPESAPPPATSSTVSARQAKTP